MSKLERNLDAIEFIHEKNEADARRSKIAVATAAIVGVLTGFLLSLTLPWLCRIMESVSSALKPGTFMMLLADNYLVIFWLITGAASTLLAINTFTATNKILSTQSVK